jgi:aspartate/methionine/tyrosine aminotransferase
MLSVNAAASAVPHSGIREISHLAMNRPAGSLVRLELGEPGAATPEHIVRAAVDASRGRTGYTASAGIAELRAAAAQRLHRSYGLPDDERLVVLGQGAVQLLSCVLAATIGPGDEVLIPDPGWPNYAMQTLVHGAKPVPYPMRAENEFQPDLDDVAALITPQTKLLIVNSPSNPTGGVLTDALARGLVELAARHGILVVSDEVYDEVVYDGRHVNLAGMDPTNVISVFSFSKTYAMTGWRVGYASFPEWIADTITKLQEAFLSCLPSASQAAALAALQGPQDFVPANLAAYRANRGAATSRLDAAGITSVTPRGAFYLMVALGDAVDSRSAAIDLVGHGVAMAPGSAFGDQTRQFLRISLASETGQLALGLDRFVDWYERSDGGARLGSRNPNVTCD